MISLKNEEICWELQHCTMMLFDINNLVWIWTCRDYKVLVDSDEEKHKKENFLRNVMVLFEMRTFKMNYTFLVNKLKQKLLGDYCL